MAENVLTGQTKPTHNQTKFQKFLGSTQHIDGTPLVHHLSQVVEKMTKNHEDKPYTAFEHVSRDVSQKRQNKGPNIKEEDDSDEDEELGYIRDTFEQTKDYIAHTASFLVIQY